MCGLELQSSVQSPACQDLLDKMEDEIGGYYSYNLYDTCGKENVLSSYLNKDRKYWSSVQPSMSLHGALNDYPCGGVGAMLKWLNNSKVTKALNIPTHAFFFLTDNGVGFNYSTNEPNLMPFYQEVNGKLRVIVYNGDTDPGINSFVSQNWTSALGFQEKLDGGWRPWTLDGMQTMGGYVTRYEGDFDFLTIRGSGHMVPEYKPAAAFEFISRWIKNEDYQKYVKPTHLEL